MAAKNEEVFVMVKKVYRTHDGKYAVGVFSDGEFLKKVYGTSEYKTREGAEKALKRRR